MKIIYIIIGYLTTTRFTFASLIDASKRFETNKNIEKVDNSKGFDFFGSLGDVFYYVLLLIIIFISLLFVLKLIRIFYEIHIFKKLVYLKVTLPKADSKLDKEKETKKDFKEKIGMMSMYYKAIHKLSNVGLKDSFLDFIFDHSKISLELVYENGELSFYIITLPEYINVVSQHITSIYNDAEVRIIDKEKEYIDIKPFGYTLRAASLSKLNDDVYPIKSFKYLEDDPLNNFTNVFSSLDKEDKAVYQIVLKPIGSRWNKKAKNAASLVAKGEYKKSRNIPFLDFFWNPIVALVQGTDSMVQGSNAPGASSGDSYKIFNQRETESHKIMGESRGQPGFRTSIRVLVSSKSPIKAKEGVHAVIASSSIFTDEYNNALDNPQSYEDGLYFLFTPIRYFAFKMKFLGFFQGVSIFSSDELSTLYHFPDINYNKSPIINWLDYKKLAPPHNLKFPKDPCILEEKVKIGQKEVIDEISGEKKLEDLFELKKVHRHLGGFPVYKDGVLMGYNEYRNKKTPIYFDKKDRGRHHYIIGKSGGGKSVFIGYLARQDMWNGDGLGVIDPHGDLVEDILAFTPKERARDTIVFDPADDEYPMGLNMLEVISSDIENRKREMDRAAMDATEIFIKIFGDEVFGPRIQHYFRNGCLTLMEDVEDGGTLIDVPRLFVDDRFMKYKTSKITNPVVKSFWEHEYANTGDREKQEMIPYFSSKFGPFITNTTIRNIIGQPKSAFNIRDIMDNKKALLVNLSKGKIGALNAQLLGLIFVSKVNMAAMSRADMREEDRKDFFMYVDEFQNFATETFGEILSEARKYKLALIMAHQFIAQIGGQNGQKGDKPSIKDAVFGNAGTIMSFKVGAEDAEYLEKEYAPLLSQQDIIGIANFTTYVKLNINNATTRPFDMKTLWDNNYKNVEAAKIIKEYSRKKYGRKKKYVDMEIEARLGIT
ncbi:type IV secretory system conjugative DNA transfer family protein [Candidatus Gracilibacteria bacterium]|nr:type IV secretory system conjugative DNA transfer family protein [Candidatus Gracilibacteria bacterium]